MIRILTLTQILEVILEEIPPIFKILKILKTLKILKNTQNTQNIQSQTNQNTQNIQSLNNLLPKGYGTNPLLNITNSNPNFMDLTKDDGLLNEEKFYFYGYFNEANITKNGMISGEEGRAFFLRTSLSRDSLIKLWDLSSDGKNYLTQKDFFVALKIAAFIQKYPNVPLTSLSQIYSIKEPLIPKVLTTQFQSQQFNTQQQQFNTQQQQFNTQQQQFNPQQNYYPPQNQTYQQQQYPQQFYTPQFNNQNQMYQQNYQQPQNYDNPQPFNNSQNQMYQQYYQQLLQPQTNQPQQQQTNQTQQQQTNQYQQQTNQSRLYSPKNETK